MGRGVADAVSHLQGQRLVHPELGIVWAHWGRVLTRGFDDARYDRLDNLEKWRAAAHNRLSICEYYTDNFAEPWVKAAARDARLAYRVGKVEKLHALAERLFEMHRQQREIRQARQSGDFGRAQALLASSRVATHELLGYSYRLADLKQGLMDGNEVPTFIKANLKNWLDEEAQAIAAKKRD